MTSINGQLSRVWTLLGPRLLPFADAATVDLPLSRLLRLSLFQISVGMAIVLLVGTLNRVMIVELGVPSALVAAMVALPILFAPVRALIGFRSDHHRSPLGWRRVPYIYIGSMLQFGGLAIMPFALLLLSEPGTGPAWAGPAGAALAFLLVGAGLHTTQTAGLALATDLAPADKRPRVVALLYVMLLVGMLLSSLVFGVLLQDFTPQLLIQVIQGAAVVTLVLNLIALWKQEARNPDKTRMDGPRPSFRDAVRVFRSEPRVGRLLLAIGLGTLAFGMQDILLEPYGGEVLGLSVASTTLLTAIWAAGMLAGFAFAARQLGRGWNPNLMIGVGALIGVVALSAVIFAAPLESPTLFRFGALLIGLGGGLFAVGGLVSAMGLSRGGQSGLALGMWGAVQATAAGLAVAAGGAINDMVSALASRGLLGAGLSDPAIGYSVVYHLEILLLFITLVVIGPMVRSSVSARDEQPQSSQDSRFGLADFPG